MGTDVEGWSRPTRSSSHYSNGRFLLDAELRFQCVRGYRGMLALVYQVENVDHSCGQPDDVTRESTTPEFNSEQDYPGVAPTDAIHGLLFDFLLVRALSSALT